MYTTRERIAKPSVTWQQHPHTNKQSKTFFRRCNHIFDQRVESSYCSLVILFWICEKIVCQISGQREISEICGIQA